MNFSLRKLTAPGPPAPERMKILAWSRKCMRGDVVRGAAARQRSRSGPGVLRFVDVEGAAAGQLDAGAAAPALLRDRDRLDALRRHAEAEGVGVVADEIDLVEAVVAAVHAELGRRQLEDQPAAAGIDARDFEHVAQEDAVGGLVLGEDHDMGAADHAVAPSFSARRASCALWAAMSWRRATSRARSRGTPSA